MAARDRYKVKVDCPKCKENGVLHLSEDDHPYMRKVHRQVDDVEGNISAVMKDDVEVSITCNVCGHQFKF